MRKSKAILLIFLVAAVFIFPKSSSGETVHKKFVYHIFWSGIRAGDAVLEFEINPDETSIKTHAKSAFLISLFYKVDDRAHSVLYPDGYPKKFSLKVRQGFHKRDKVTYFERKTKDKPQKVIYHNIRDDESVEFYFDEPAYDPLSAFYAMTRWNFDIGKPVYIDIFDNKKFWRTEVQVLRKEKVRVPAGEFNTIVIKPLLKSEGIFLKAGNIYIWATDDDRKLPVKLKSKASIGYFTALLVEGDY